MGIIKKSPASRKDFVDIWNFIAAQGKPDAASGLLDEFDASLSMLADHPMAGAARLELQPKLRSYPVGNYIIFYKPMRNGIQLVRVIHGSRDISRIFRR